jgi:hypothetical protein
VWHQSRDAFLDVLRTPVGTTCLILLALVAIGLGVCLIVMRRLPAWVRGPLKWPLGHSVTPRVLVIYGSAGIVAGVGLAIVTFALRSSSRELVLELAILALVLAAASATLTIWSLVLSRQAPRLTSS